MKKQTKIIASIVGQYKGAVGVAALAFVAGTANIASADIIPYGNVGTVNSTLYTFNAAASGNIEAYFAGSSAGYDTEIGMLINGVSSGIIGLDDHSSTVGQSLNLGSVNAGDVITFELINNSLGGAIAYSNPSLNGAYDHGVGQNHIYSTMYTRTVDIGGSLPIPLSANIPVGTYVGFEDQAIPGADLDYNDETFIFTDIATTTSTVPDSSFSLSLLIIGFAGIGLLRRRLCV